MLSFFLREICKVYYEKWLAQVVRATPDKGVGHGFDSRTISFIFSFLKGEFL